MAQKRDDGRSLMKPATIGSPVERIPNRFQIEDGLEDDCKSYIQNKPYHAYGHSRTDKPFPSADRGREQYCTGANRAKGIAKGEARAQVVRRDPRAEGDSR